MSPNGPNRFEDFFADGTYVRLKNDLYNYRLRCRAIRQALGRVGRGPILEVGSGLSPTVNDGEAVTYAELSFAALRRLKGEGRQGSFVVSDAVLLPFRDGVFVRVVCSEVLEHLPDDRTALAEMVRVLAPGGELILTVPHRQAYFAVDDRFVHHRRRYEIPELERMLGERGLRTVEIRKVLGPMEKLLMMTVTALLSLKPCREPEGAPVRPSGREGPSSVMSLIFKGLNRTMEPLLWLDARIMPRFWAAVLLFRCVRVDIDPPSPDGM